jgi:hypothetical protein
MRRWIPITTFEAQEMNSGRQYIFQQVTDELVEVIEVGQNWNIPRRSVYSLLASCFPICAACCPAMGTYIADPKAFEP